METQQRPTVSPDRGALAARYTANRQRTAGLFRIPTPEAYEDRPIPLRLPIVFYDGHIPAFTYNTLMRGALGRPSIDPLFERIFERGIDPATQDAAQPRVAPPSWPDRGAVSGFAEQVDRAVLDAFANEELSDAARSPLLDRAQAAYTILEHEDMHQETLMYLLHRLPYDRKRAQPAVPAAFEAQPAASGRVHVAAGEATLGARRDAVTFGWDNEFEETRQRIDAFEIDVNSVTNADWLAFVRDGGPLPPFWREKDGEFEYLAQFEAVPLPPSWPVFVTWKQAADYATWRGGRLPTEGEYHRAAFGTPWGEERRFPWGEASPSRAHGNFGFQRFDPEPVGTRAAGASAWGINDLIGNGREWTSTVFAPLPGFEPMASYPLYSTDFFDGEHYVMKGASPVTPTTLIRRSFRNWFRADYPYMYAKFRLVYD